MRFQIGALFLCFVPIFAQDAERDFSGSWILDDARSAITLLPWQPDRTMKITHTDAGLVIVSEHGERKVSTSDASSQSLSGLRLSTRTKWEGQALLINSLSASGKQFNVNDRWRLARDRNTLTIRRQYLAGTAEHESALVYLREGAVTQPAPATAGITPSVTPAPARPVPPQTLTINAGTHIPLKLLSSVDTQSSARGDRIYLETVRPVSVDNRIVIPRGSQVTAFVTQSTRAGRAKGRAQLVIRFEKVVLPNGADAPLYGHVTSADGRPIDRSEGVIRGEDDRAGDVRKTGETTAAGAGVGAAVGSAAGSAGAGAAIGAAAGAAAGLGRVFGSRGPDLKLAPGTILEVTLDRDLEFPGKTR